MMKKYVTKILGSIAPHDLIKTRNFINVMVFPLLIKILVIVSCKINIVSKKYSVGCFVYFPSVL